MTRITPLRLTIWQYSHLRLTDALTFIKNPLFGLFMQSAGRSDPFDCIFCFFKQKHFVINTQKNPELPIFFFKKIGNQRQVLHYAVKKPFSPDFFVTDTRAVEKRYASDYKLHTHNILHFFHFSSPFFKKVQKKISFFYRLTC